MRFNGCDKSPSFKLSISSHILRKYKQFIGGYKRTINFKWLIIQISITNKAVLKIFLNNIKSIHNKNTDNLNVNIKNTDNTPGTDDNTTYIDYFFTERTELNNNRIKRGVSIECGLHAK